MFNEELYIKLRTKEGRLYHDNTVRDLPYLKDVNSKSDEWKIRAGSFDRLKKYLKEKNKPLNILDLGCGNGWMTSRLSEINQSTVTGVDMNLVELKQALRLFSGNNRIKFLYGDIFENIVEEKNFDVIVLAASIQYFEDVKKLLNRLIQLLKGDGEIHILDSHFYSDSEKPEAQKRTMNHYKKLGFPEFAECYHHHTWNELNGFNFKILNRSLIDKIHLRYFGKKYLLFPWIVVNKNLA